MMYPAVILLTMIIIGILMMIYVVPTLLSTFSELKVKLPPATQFVLTVSNLFQHHGLLMLIILLVSIGSLVWWSKRESGKAFIHALVLESNRFFGSRS